MYNELYIHTILYVNAVRGTESLCMEPDKVSLPVQWSELREVIFIISSFIIKVFFHGSLMEIKALYITRSQCNSCVW